MAAATIVDPFRRYCRRRRDFLGALSNVSEVFASTARQFGYHCPPAFLPGLLVLATTRWRFLVDTGQDDVDGRDRRVDEDFFSYSLSRLATVGLVLAASSWLHACVCRRNIRSMLLVRPKSKSRWPRWFFATEEPLPPFLTPYGDKGRVEVMGQLIVSQLQKKNRRGGKAKLGTDTGNDDTDGNYAALVTGASRGIGRALAVELARYSPTVSTLVLVARNIRELEKLAAELQQCYGVRTFMIQADLSERDAARRVYETVRKARLRVRILINNAGIAAHGPFIGTSWNNDKHGDHSAEHAKTITDMIRLNVEASTMLSYFFGRDMATNTGRGGGGGGRILFVSSLCGAASGIASVAVYAATKAYETSLATSLAIEFEPYGVAVLCLVPGAVQGTAFKSASRSDEALCWRVPYYPANAEDTAAVAVRALLHGREIQIVPGLLNRAFVVLKASLPQRIHNWVAQIMWNPVPDFANAFASIFGTSAETRGAVAASPSSRHHNRDAKNYAKKTSSRNQDVSEYPPHPPQPLALVEISEDGAVQ